MECATARLRSLVSAMGLMAAASSSRAQLNASPSGETSEAGDTGVQPQSRKELTAPPIMPADAAQRWLGEASARERAAAQAREIPAFRSAGAPRNWSKSEETTC